MMKPECTCDKSMQYQYEPCCIHGVLKPKSKPTTPAERSSGAAPGYNPGRIFTVGELWGPMACEMEGCPDKEVYSILLTDKENANLRHESGPEAVIQIFNQRLGYALCNKHLAEKIGI